MFRAVSKLGLASSDVTILDYEEFQDGSAWDRHQLAAVLLKHIEVTSVFSNFLVNLSTSHLRNLSHVFFFRN